MCDSCPEMSLIRLIEGDATEEEETVVRIHLQHCEECRQNVDMLMTLRMAVLEDAARREEGDCPEFETLIEFRRGLLKDDEALRIQNHILSCEECRKDVKLLRGFEEKRKRGEI